MASSRVPLALAVVVVLALLAVLVVGTDVLPAPLGPERIEGTPEPFATTADTTAPTSSTSDATTSDAGTLTTLDGAATITTRARDTRTPIERTPIEPATTADITETDDDATYTTTSSTLTNTRGGASTDRRYERARVTISDANGTDLATVRTWIADTEAKRYTGLSNTVSLRNGTGMLFVYDGDRDLTYVMREMNYPLDIIFVGADRRINKIAPAPAPDPGQDGNDIRRSGTGKWVLEVPRGWTNATGIEEGDRLTIERSS